GGTPLPFLPTFGEFFDHGAIKGWDVIRFTAGHQAVVGNRFPVDPVSTGVLQIGLERRPGGNGTVSNDIRLDQRPGAVADGGNRFAGFEEFAHELDRLWLEA